MTVRERFQIGQKVELTPEAQRRNFRVYSGSGRHRVTTGTVKGFSRKDDVVRILPEGAKCVQNYYMHLWQPAETEPAS